MRSIGRRVEALMVWGRAWESITSAYRVQKSLLRGVISWQALHVKGVCTWEKQMETSALSDSETLVDAHVRGEISLSIWLPCTISSRNTSRTRETS
jgi:hypothetical protein